MGRTGHTGPSGGRSFMSRFAGPMLACAVLLAGAALSLMRAASADETIYLRDAVIMADCMREGEWFGNEAVGLHGWVMKLPAALLFLLFGRSVTAATLVTVMFAAAASWMCYRLARRVLGSDSWAAACTFMVITNYHFVQTTPTFLRDIPAMLAVLLFVDAVLHRRSRWVLGLLMLLLLDAKEYVFYILAPAFLVWVVVDEIHLSRDAGKGHLCRQVAARWTAGLLPSAAYIMLMLCTGAVPLNMYNVYILGLTDCGPSQMLAKFHPAVATRNFWENGRTTSQLADAEGPLSPVVAAVNFILPYIGKLLYPRTFSFIAIPKVVVLPAAAMSIRVFRRWRRDGLTQLLILPLATWIYLLIYVLRASHGRYLVPVLPLVVLHFCLFMKEGFADRRFAAWVLTATGVMFAIGMCFELNYVPFKIVLNLSALSLLILAFRAAGGNAGKGDLFARGTAVVIGLQCITVALASSVLLPGQIGNWLMFGKNRECGRVVSEFGAEERVWINPMEWNVLPQALRGDRADTPEWHWVMRDDLPRKYMLDLHDPKTHSFVIRDMADFRDSIGENRITTVAMLASDLPGKPFYQQERLDELMAQEWLRLDRTVELKNKKLHVFSVID